MSITFVDQNGYTLSKVDIYKPLSKNPKAILAAIQCLIRESRGKSVANIRFQTS